MAGGPEASSMSRNVVAVLVVALAWVGPASAASPAWTGRYTVQPGDSLSAIAQHYDISLPALADANKLDWRRPLPIGVVLRVPSATAASPRWAGTYVVQPGDTLTGIALRYHLSLAQLASANSIDPARVLLIGARLRVPTVGAAVDLAHIVQSDPYHPGALGYDASYPNCAARLPAEHAFAIVGLNAGRPFTSNPCFASEWAAAQPTRSVYINTAYGPTLARHITPGCAAAGRTQPFGLVWQRAYAVGCSEAVDASQQLGGTTGLTIWLDVELSNTWSSRRMLNAAAIRGILDQLLTEAAPPTVGIYSNASSWLQIVGGWSSLSVPEWVATGAPDPPGCPTGFADGPVWLSQSIDRHHDVDKVC